MQMHAPSIDYQPHITIHSLSDTTRHDLAYAVAALHYNIRNALSTDSCHSSILSTLDDPKSFPDPISPPSLPLLLPCPSSVSVVILGGDEQTDRAGSALLPSSSSDVASQGLDADGSGSRKNDGRAGEESYGDDAPVILFDANAIRQAPPPLQQQQLHHH